MANLVLQPKQTELLLLVNASGESTASWIGIGGGRGGAKSTALQRIMLIRRQSNPGTLGAMVMRNYDQVKRYHIDPMLRDFPELVPLYHKTDSKIVMPGKRRGQGASEIHFTYAESLEDVIRRFRSASYFDVFVDQAEQFTEAELREIKQCVRWSKVPQGTCKLVLAFNMGGIGIDFLRRVFHLRDVQQNERKEDFSFIHVHPWDNVEWVRPALAEDGLTERDYYGGQGAKTPLSEDQRQAYCATRGDYGRNLVAQDDPIVKRDWLGSWESLEGAYFARVFDRSSTVISHEQTVRLLKPWTKRWLAMDWGRGHYAPVYWNAKIELSPKEAQEVLGWDIETALPCVITYREYIAGGAADKDEGGDRELAEADIAAQIVYRTPLAEKEAVRAFFLSPDAFAKRQSANTIASTIGAVARSGALPSPAAADNDRIGGWSLMYNMLLATKNQGHNVEPGVCLWLISANCPELIETIPLLMRDPKNLDDVLKTDTGSVKMEQDCGDAIRYAMKSMLKPSNKPRSVEVAEVLDGIPDMHRKSMMHRAMLAGKMKGVTRRVFHVH